MASRAARRNRHRASLTVKARQSRPPGVTFTTDQVHAMLAAQQQLTQGRTRSRELPTSPYWELAPFGPGRRLPPAAINVPRTDTGRAEPRLFEYPVATNLNIASAPLVPWKTLQQAADMPLFRKCIERRKGVCELDYAVTVDPKAVAREAAATGQAEKDIESAVRKQFTSEIARVSDWLEYPDRGNGHDWTQWAKLLFENRLKYDATCVYPLYTYGGDVHSFQVIDGHTIKPLTDERGGRPAPPYPAFQQVMYGFPRTEHTADTDPKDIDPATGKPRVQGGYPADMLLYERTVMRPETLYGMSATEIALLDGMVWMRRMGWILAEYTEGVQPAAFLKTDNALEWDVPQWEEWARALNDMLSGNTQQRQRWPLMPPGVEPVQSAEVPERYKPDYDMFLIKLVAGDFGLTATELGFPEVGSLGASFHEGEEDVLNRVTRLPDARWLGRIATRLCVRHLRMPPVLRVQVLGLESEDESAQDQTAQNRTQSARMTLNEDRARRGEPPYQFKEADMPMLLTQRGVVFLEGASEHAPPGTLVEPAHTELPPGSGDGADGGTPSGNGAAKPAGQNGKPKDSRAAKAADAGTAVYEQLAEDYPASAMGWVHHTTWRGPVNVPTDHIDMSGRKSWAANKETSKVEHFKAKIQAKGKTKPVVLVKTPGSEELKVVDGHHRTLAYDELGLPVRAWVGTVATDKGPWDVMHDYQYTAGEQRAAGEPVDDSDATPAAKQRSASRTAVDQATVRNDPRCLGADGIRGIRRLGSQAAAGETLPADDAAAKAELDQFRAWARKGTRARPFVCQILTKALAASLAPDLLGDERVVFKAGDPGPKALASSGTGPAGKGTWTS